MYGIACNYHMPLTFFGLLFRFCPPHESVYTDSFLTPAAASFWQ